MTSDRKVTSDRSTNAAITVLRKAALERPFDVIVTSPGINDEALTHLVRRILKVGLKLTLVPVVLQEEQADRAFKIGADAVLTLADDSLVNPGEVFRRFARRFSSPPRSTAAVEAPAKTSSSARVIADLLKVRKYLPKTRVREPITVDVVARVDADLTEAAARLVPQLSTSARVPGQWELGQIVKEPGTALIVAREGRVIVGMLTLHTFRATTGIHAWIQDLVVDKAAKGRGVSELLTQEAVRLSAERGAHTTELASRPSRAGTGRLYERLGFELRQAQLYRHRLSS